MNAPTLAGVASVLCMMALAGCTGNFAVHQTEPLRVQIDGLPQTVTVRQNDTQAQGVVFVTKDVEQVNVKVEAHKVATGPCKLHVVVKDKDTGETLEERDVDVGDDDDHTATMTTTETNSTTVTVTETTTATTTTTAQPSSSTTVVQNFVLNVKGHNNVVVLANALQGEAQVSVSATNTGGHSTVGGSTASGSASASLSDSATNSTTSGP